MAIRSDRVWDGWSCQAVRKGKPSERNNLAKSCLNPPGVGKKRSVAMAWPSGMGRAQAGKGACSNKERALPRRVRPIFKTPGTMSAWRK